MCTFGAISIVGSLPLWAGAATACGERQQAERRAHWHHVSLEQTGRERPCIRQVLQELRLLVPRRTHWHLACELGL
jgi:shikimate kinase